MRFFKYIILVMISLVSIEILEASRAGKVAEAVYKVGVTTGTVAALSPKFISYAYAEGPQTHQFDPNQTPATPGYKYQQPSYTVPLYKQQSYFSSQPSSIFLDPSRTMPNSSMLKATSGQPIFLDMSSLTTTDQSKAQLDVTPPPVVETAPKSNTSQKISFPVGGLRNMTFAQRMQLSSQLQQAHPDLYKQSSSSSNVSNTTELQLPTNTNAPIITVDQMVPDLISAPEPIDTTQEPAPIISNKKQLTAAEVDLLKNSSQAQSVRQARADNAHQISHEQSLSDEHSLTLFDSPDVQMTHEQSISQPEHEVQSTRQDHEPIIVSPSSHVAQPDVTAMIKQQYIDETITKASKAIEFWPYYRDESMTDVQHQNVLEHNILDLMTIKTEDGKLVFTDPTTDLEILSKLAEKYHDDPKVVTGLRLIAKTVQDHTAAQKVTPRQANNALARYYTPAMRADIFALIKTEPHFDATGSITNMPTIETIIKTAMDNPSPQAYKALQTSLQATQVAIFAFRGDTSLLGDGNLLAQLKLFEKNITTSLNDSRFTPFQSWGSYAASFIPTILTSTPIGSITNAQVVGLGKTALNTTSSLLSFTGYGKTNTSQLLEMTGLMPSQTKAPASEPVVIPEHQTAANNSISQYYTPAMQQDMHAMMQTGKPAIDPFTGSITNMPSVEQVIQSALTKPDQQAFNALQSTLEATQVAIFANKNGDAKLKAQLKAYEAQLKTALQDPNLAKFHSLTTRATTYLAQFLPDTKTVLDTTGVGNVTASQLIDLGQSVLSAADTALYVTGQGNRTVAQTLGYNS